MQKTKKVKELSDSPTNLATNLPPAKKPKITNKPYCGTILNFLKNEYKLDNTK
jgi:hypothetical protein